MSLLKLKEELLPIGITVSETNKISRYNSFFFMLQRFGKCVYTFVTANLPGVSLRHKMYYCKNIK